MARKFFGGSLKRLRLCAAAVCATFVAVPTAEAAIINLPVPTNTFITQSGLNWAWARPLPAGGTFSLAFQGTQGWRLPTLAELGFAPLATDFIFPGANVPLGGVDPVSNARFQAVNAALNGAAACATPYFDSSFVHCDWQDGLGQPAGPWAGLPGAASFADQLVVRTAAGGPPADDIPEPGTLTLFGVGLLGLGLVARRRRKSA